MDDSKRRPFGDDKGATLNGAFQSLTFLISFTEVLSWILGTESRKPASDRSQFPKLPTGRSYEITIHTSYDTAVNSHSVRISSRFYDTVHDNKPNMSNDNTTQRFCYSIVRRSYGSTVNRFHVSTLNTVSIAQ